MKTELSTADKLRKTLKIKIELATETVGDGQATLEAEVFAAGEAVMIVDGEERIPLPIGEYELDNGMILVVVEEGMISEVKEKAAEGEEGEAAASEGEEAKPLPKAIIESVVKETKFSKEQITEAFATLNPTKDEVVLAKDKEITELKLKVVELSKVNDDEEIEETPEEKITRLELELSTKGAVENPDEKGEKPKPFDKSGKTAEQVMMHKMANRKN